MMDLYAIKDKLVGFTGPIAMKNEDVAKRWFTSFCRDKKEKEFTESKYYELWKIGNFNEEKGTIIGLQLSELQLIMEGEQFDERKN